MIEMSKKQDRPRPKYYSFHQDFALALCREKYGTCPRGCAKDGAPNCNANVMGLEFYGYAPWQCEPGKLTAERAREHEAWLNLQYPQREEVRDDS
jgi:hypothetical protein